MVPRNDAAARDEQKTLEAGRARQVLLCKILLQEQARLREDVQNALHKLERGCRARWQKNTKINFANYSHQVGQITSYRGLEALLRKFREEPALHQARVSFGTVSAIMAGFYEVVVAERDSRWQKEFYQHNEKYRVLYSFLKECDKVMYAFNDLLSTKKNAEIPRYAPRDELEDDGSDNALAPIKS